MYQLYLTIRTTNKCTNSTLQYATQKCTNSTVQNAPQEMYQLLIMKHGSHLSGGRLRSTMPSKHRWTLSEPRPGHYPLERYVEWQGEGVDIYPSERYVLYTCMSSDRGEGVDIYSCLRQVIFVVLQRARITISTAGISWVDQKKDRVSKSVRK